MNTLLRHVVTFMLFILSIFKHSFVCTLDGIHSNESIRAQQHSDEGSEGNSAPTCQIKTHLFSGISTIMLSYYYYERVIVSKDTA